MYPRLLRLFSLSLSLLLLGLARSSFANTAVEPVPRDEKWMKRHESFVAEAKAGEINVLFLGDSITDFWRDRGKAIWDKYYASEKAANFGISADRTQHLLWRIENGELDGLDPKVVVLLIGTNNTGLERDRLTPRNTAEEAVEGVKAVVMEIRKRLPNSKLLTLAVFPRGEPTDPARTQITQINDALAALADGKHIFFLDFGRKFLDADGNIPKALMPDLLHPSVEGYEIWGDSMRETLKNLLKPDAN